MKKRVALSIVAALAGGLLAAAPASAAATGPFATTAGNIVTAGSVSYTQAAGVDYVTITQTAGAGNIVKIWGVTSVDGSYNSVAVTGGTLTKSSKQCKTAGNLFYTATSSTVYNSGTEDLCGADTDATAFSTGYITVPVEAVGTTTVTVKGTVTDGNGLTTTDTLQVYTVKGVAAASTTPSATYSAATLSNPTPMSGTAVAYNWSNDFYMSIKSTENGDLNGKTVRAVVSGPGTIYIYDDNNPGNWNQGRDVEITLGANSNDIGFELGSDGNSGSTTVKLYVGTTLLATTDAFLFYGALSSLTATKLGGTAAAGGNVSEGVELVGKDAAGNLVDLWNAGYGTAGVSSSDEAAFSSSAAVNCRPGTGAVLDFPVNELICDTPNAAGLAASGAKANLTYSIIVSSTSTVKAAPVSFSVGGSAKTVTVAFDKSSYAPGERAKVTVTVKDSSGNAAADANNAAMFAGAWATNLTSATATIGTAAANYADGVASFYVYAPATTGTWTLKNTFGAGAPTALVATSVSVSAAVAVPVDPSVAANAAAVATLQTSVAALQTTVASLVASMTAQIKVINAALAKIAKKLKVKL